MRGSGRAALVALTLATLVAAHAQEGSWRARLATVPIDPATAASVTGLGEAVAELDGRSLTVTGSFAGLAGPATIAQLHEGAYTGVRGDSIADLTVTPAKEGSISGTVELTRAQAESLRAGRLYVQIHSESAPDGNLWGWLLP